MGEWTAERRAAAAERCRSRLEKHGHPMQGKKRSPEVKDKISKSLKNRFKDPKERERLSKQQIAVMKDPEVRARISRAARTTKKDPKYREKMSKLAKARMKNPEVREKMSESAKKTWEDPARRAEYSERTKLQLERDGHPMKGKKHRPESIKKMSESHKAMTPETRHKISKSQKKRFEDPKEREKSRVRATELMKDPAFYKRAVDGLHKARSAIKNTLPEKWVQYILGQLCVEYEIQHRIRLNDGKSFIVDVFVKPDIVIEVNGDYWHAGPGYESGIPGGKAAHVVRRSNAQRTANLRKKGYMVVEVWESDLKKHTAATIRRLADACGVKPPMSLVGRYYSDIADAAVKYEAGLRKERQQKQYAANRDKRLARNRERWRMDPVYREKHKAAAKALRPKTNAARRAKYADDLAYRVKVNERNKNAYQRASPEQVEKRTDTRRANYQKNRLQIRAKQNTKYADDEAFREQQKARSRQRSKTHKDEISRKNKERHNNMTPAEKAKWSTDRHEYYMKNRDQIRKQKKEKRQNPEFLARERAQHKAYREYNSEKIKSQKAEAYKKKKLQNTAAIVDELGGRCFKCGRESPDMLVGADMDAARADGHVHKRSTAWQYYVGKPAEAKKYLRLSCLDCKDWHGGMR